MDFVKNAMSGANDQGQRTQNNQSNEQKSEGGGGGGFLGGIGDKLNTAAGGGKESEKNEDLLDKGTVLSSIPRNLICAQSFRL